MRGKKDRRLVAPNLGLKPVSIELAVPRVEGRACGVVRQVRLGFADPYRFYTRSFERLADYDHRISTGPLEGMNNKIKTMRRQAYGFRNKGFFRLKIMGVHEAKHALVG